MDSFDSYYLACRGEHEEHAARLAPVIGVHSCVSLLIALILKMLVLAVVHWWRLSGEGILAFGGSSGPEAARA